MRRLVHTVRAELQARRPGLSAVEDLVADDARHALLRAASESEMTVLGSRGIEPAESYFLGDVGMPVVARAGRPVVLVRADRREGGAAAPGVRGRVVVAPKLHGSCDDLFDFAFRTAAAGGVPLLAVHGRGVPLHTQVPQGADHEVTEKMRRDARTRLDKAVRPWRERHPQVDVAGSVRLTSPAQAVVRAAEGAVLPAVGRRRHRPARAPHLGPVAQAALHHGRCPVAVVPHG